MSELAVLVVTSAIPIDLLAQELEVIYARSGERGRVETAVQARVHVMSLWQYRWDHVIRGR